MKTQALTSAKCQTAAKLLFYEPSHHTTTVLWPFFRDHPGEPVPEENF